MVSGVNIITMMLQGFALGISMGIYCTFGCMPAILPLIVANGNGMRDSLCMVMQYLAGRIAAYALVGTLAISFGQLITSYAVGRTMTAIALVALAIILMVHAIKVNFPQLRICNFRPQALALKLVSKSSISIPFVAGFAIGMNMCPPILTAYAYALTTGHVIASVAFLGSFFIATALFALPISFVWLLGKLPPLKGMAQAAIMLSALWFASQGIAIIVGR